jgi:hypothetical protein
MGSVYEKTRGRQSRATVPLMNPCSTRKQGKPFSWKENRVYFLFKKFIFIFAQRRESTPMLSCCSCWYYYTIF